MSNVRVSTTVVLIPDPSSWKTLSMDVRVFPVPSGSPSTTSTSPGAAGASVVVVLLLLLVVVVMVVVATIGGGRVTGSSGRPGKKPDMASPGLRGLSAPPEGSPPPPGPPPNGGPIGLTPEPPLGFSDESPPPLGSNMSPGRF